MKRFSTILVLVLAMASLMWGQSPNPRTITKTYSATGATAILTENGAFNVHVLTFTKSGTVSGCAVALQSATTYGGSYATLGAAQTCTSTGTYVYYGTANFVKVNMTSWTGTGSVVVTYKAYNIPYTYMTDCLTSISCAAPVNVPAQLVAYGQGALSSASPSLAHITGIAPAFTDTSHMFCTASPIGTTAAIAAGGLAINLVSGSAFDVTGPNTVTTSFFWVCVGN